MTGTNFDWLTEPALTQLFDLFEGQGHQLLCVGGCVRNALLDQPIHDIDLATDARPEDMLALADKAGVRAIPTGIEHGTITFVIDAQSFEVTTFRKDIETDGRHATVAFSDRLEDDAERRDLTINALYMGRDGTVIDPTGGRADIAARHVRFIGDPAARIAEDHLRILRFFRFHAWYADPDGGVDADGLAGCAEGAAGLEHLSAERIGAEMIKLLSAPDPAPAVAAMEHAGILARVMPGASSANLAVLVHLEEGDTHDWRSRALILGTEDLKDRWRLSKRDAQELQLMQDLLRKDIELPELAYRHGPCIARSVALVRAAQLSSPRPDKLELVIAQAAAQRFPVAAADLMPELSGPELGARLAALEAEWIASGFTLDRATLLKK